MADMNLDRKIKIGKREFVLLDFLMFLGLIITGVFLRAVLFEYESGDWEVFLEPWTNQLKTFGFRALSTGWYNYTPIYMYILWILSMIGGNTLAGIKAVSCIFDFFMAVVAGRIFKEWNKKGNFLIPFGIVWLAPTVISNSSMWGQCDSIYTTFILLCLLYLEKGKSSRAMFYYGIAFSLKLQSVFLAPMLLLWFFMKKIKFREFFWIPVIYFLSIIPVWIAGRPLKELLLIYFGQSAGKYPCLSVNYPNIYYLIGNDVYLKLFSTAGIGLTVAVLLVLFYYVLKKGYSDGISWNVFIQVALLSGSIILFLLPSMHERYSYMVDIIAILYGLMNYRKLYVPMLRIFISYMAYTTYYRYGMFTSYELLVAVQIFLIADGVYTLLKTFREEKKADAVLKRD